MKSENKSENTRLESYSRAQLIYLAKGGLQLEKNACEKRLYDFFKSFWPVVCKERYVENWHIPYLCDTIQPHIERVINREDHEYEYIIVNIPPGSTKSLLFSVTLPAWGWVKDQTLRFITGSWEASLATDFAVKARDLMKSPKFVSMWGDIVHFKRDEDGKTSYSNELGGFRKIATVGGSIIGRHAHVQVIDDPLDPNQAYSEVAKKRANDWLDNVLSMRRTDKGVTLTIIVQQRLAEDDTTGHLLEGGAKVLHINLPGELTDLDNVKPPELNEKYRNGLFDPVRLSRPALQKARMNLGSKGYSNQILQHPAAAEGTIFKREWWGFYDSFPATRIIRNIHSWDTDFGKKAATNGAVFARQYDNGLYMTGLFKESLEFPQLDEKIRAQHIEDPCTSCLIEDKASGQSEIQVLQQQTVIPVVPIKPMADKVTRAYACSPFVEAGKVLLPRGAWWVNWFIDMTAAFPDIKHKDVADAFTQMINWVMMQPVGLNLGGARSSRHDVDSLIRHQVKKAAEIRPNISHQSIFKTSKRRRAHAY